MKETLDNICFVHNSCAEERRLKFQSDNVRLELIKGDFVKIGVPIKDSIELEHMWFEVTRKVSKNQYEGRCDNDPLYDTVCKFDELYIFNFSEVEQMLDRDV